MQHYQKGFGSEAARAVMEDYYEMLFKRKSFHLFRETDVISKMPSEKFRKDMFKAKRKPVSEIWDDELLPVADIVRFAPSACVHVSILTAIHYILKRREKIRPQFFTQGMTT